MKKLTKIVFLKNVWNKGSENGHSNNGSQGLRVFQIGKTTL